MLFDFYLNLPSYSLYHKLHPNFYVPGYTETLALVSGVKVVSLKSDLSEVDIEYRNKFYLEKPYYYIPVKRGKENYGFILKGSKKPTPRDGIINYLIFNLDALDYNFPFIILVEGIKDSYPLLALNLPVISMLTTTVSIDFISLTKSLKKDIIFIPDNDLAGKKSIIQWEKICLKNKIRYLPFSITGCKDFGDWFDVNYRFIVKNNIDRLLILLNNLFCLSISNNLN